MTAEWLLIAMFLAKDGGERQILGHYERQSDCGAAAERFVAAHPGFDLRQNSRDATAIHPVSRSYVECVKPDMAPGGERDD